LSDSPSFVFTTCQIGAEPALKQEAARAWPTLRFAFSRPGFLTFKVAPGKKLPEDFAAKLVFARAAGFCLGKVSEDTPAERADLVWKLIGDRKVTQIHVWPRDRYSPGFHDYEPGMTEEAVKIERIIRERAPQHLALVSPISASARPMESTLLRGAAGGASQEIINVGDRSVEAKFDVSQRRQTRPRDLPCPPLLRREVGALVADVVLVDDDEWWVGHHRLHSPVSSWPGGYFHAMPPTGAVSRAYLKMNEALLWSGFQVKPGERCVEIGSAPGGASQFLLAQGLEVIGIDPAEMHPAVLADPHFRQIRKRSKEVPRSEFIGVDWLTCDVNLPPNYTLDTVKAIVSHPGVRFKGLLLTLKLVEWSLAGEIPKYLDRIRSWGCKDIHARQLHHNRQEVCVAVSGFRPHGGKPAKPQNKRRRQPNPSHRSF
jgi:23S rRNA (cytidine2498-2'-O)-methyltransferase